MIEVRLQCKDRTSIDVVDGRAQTPCCWYAVKSTAARGNAEDGKRTGHFWGALPQCALEARARSLGMNDPSTSKD